MNVALLQHKEVRKFLNQYAPHERVEVALYALLSGSQALTHSAKRKGKKKLTLDETREYVEKKELLNELEEAAPMIAKSLDSIQQQLSSFQGMIRDPPRVICNRPSRLWRKGEGRGTSAADVLQDDDDDFMDIAQKDEQTSHVEVKVRKSVGERYRPKSAQQRTNVSIPKKSDYSKVKSKIADMIEADRHAHQRRMEQRRTHRYDVISSTPSESSDGCSALQFATHFLDRDWFGLFQGTTSKSAE